MIDDKAEISSCLAIFEKKKYFLSIYANAVPEICFIMYLFHFLSLFYAAVIYF